MPLAVGLMSGTSIDGVDAALVEISGRSPNLKIKLRHWNIFSFPKGWKKRILAVSHPAQAGIDEVCRLNFELGDFFAQCALKLCRQAKISPKKLHVIGSHGQTICHLGESGTLQIGEPSVIAERTGVMTVADFRPRDIACGGHGAPLAPYLHYLLFRHPRKNRSVHNLGGISNLTYLPKGCTPKQVIGFDTGPANMLIDGLLHVLDGNADGYDHGGKIAAKGRIALPLLKELMSHPFILKKPPKSSGREEFGKILIKKVLGRSKKLKLKKEDIIATATAFTASSIAENYRKFVFPKGVPDEIIFGGGGVHNATLMRMIKAELPDILISDFDFYRIPADAAEAVCFAVLAYETLSGRPTNIPSVTGAKSKAVLGKIIPGRMRG